MLRSSIKAGPRFAADNCFESRNRDLGAGLRRPFGGRLAIRRRWIPETEFCSGEIFSGPRPSRRVATTRMFAMGKAKSPRRKSAARLSTFSEYQRMVEKTDERRSRTASLLGLVGEIGDLHSSIKKLLLQKASPQFREELREEFGDVLWYLTSLASLYRISLQEISDENAQKARSLYSTGNLSRFDRSFPKDERLPRKFTATFVEKPVDRGVYVKITVNGVAVGDVLTDNAHVDDGYRFHDVFHLAYAAVLGWSPVIRSLLKCKRKSKPKIDEVEDGARATIIEEAVSILVFNQAETWGWYAESSSVGIGLLKTIQRLVAGLEVASCTAKQWQNAIHQGYLAFVKLKVNGGGDVHVDLDKQTVTFAETPTKVNSP